MQNINRSQKERWRATALSCAIILTLSACGSTAQPAGLSEIQAGPELSDGIAGSDLPVDEATAPNGTSPATIPSRDATGGNTQGTTPSDGGNGHDPDDGNGSDDGDGSRSDDGDGSGSDVGATTGRGFTANEIYIGYATAKGASEFFKAAGADSNFGDQEAVARAMADDINARGGVSGRKVVPIFYDFGSADAADIQAACTRWTEDQPVFAVVKMLAHNVGGADRLLAGCLAQRQTPLVSVANTMRPDSMYAELAPYLWAPREPSIERYVPVWLGRAAAIGYFEGWNTATRQPSASTPTKVGILSNESSYGDDFTQVVSKELKRLGQPVAATFSWSGNRDTAGSEFGSAVLRFRQRDITHVIPQDGSVVTAFTAAANAQNYWPRLAISSATGPSSTVFGAMGVGWFPTLDVPPAHAPGAKDIPGQERCREIMENAGQDTSSQAALRIMVSTCDGFWFLANAIDEGGLSVRGMQRGAQTSGRLAPASTFQISFEKNQFSGSIAVRDMAFDDSCRCFVYLDARNHDM